MDDNNLGYRKCDEQSCDAPATHSLVWTGERHAYCISHLLWLLQVAASIGYAEAKGTVRILSLDEMKPTDTQPGSPVGG